MLNAFNIPYRVLHDVDTNNPNAFAVNARISAALPAIPGYAIHTIGPEDLEGLLGYTVSKGTSKPFAAVKQVEQLHAQNALPQGLIEAMNMAFFGQSVEPIAN